MRPSTKQRQHDNSVKENRHAYDRYGAKGGFEDSETDGDGGLLEEEEGERVYEEGTRYSSEQLIEFADKLLRADSNRELCRRCKEKDDSKDFLPYGEETGVIESKVQEALDDEGNQLYLDFPELKCKKGHRWFKGEEIGRASCRERVSNR